MEHEKSTLNMCTRKNYTTTAPNCISIPVTRGSLVSNKVIIQHKQRNKHSCQNEDRRLFFLSYCILLFLCIIVMHYSVHSEGKKLSLCRRLGAHVHSASARLPSFRRHASTRGRRSTLDAFEKVPKSNVRS